MAASHAQKRCEGYLSTVKGSKKKKNTSKKSKMKKKTAKK